MHDTQDLNLMKRRTHLLNPLPANFAVACRIASLQCQKSNNICQMPHGFSLFKNTQVAIFPVAVTSFWAQLRVRWVFQKWSASDISDEPFVILKQPKECCKYASNIIDKSLTTAANSQEIGYTKLSVSIYWAQICVALSGYLIRHSKSTNFNILTYLRGYQSVGIVASWLPKLQRGVLIEK